MYKFPPGDVLGIQSVKTWEFEGNAPIRSIVVPMATTAAPLLLWQQVATMTPVTLLVLPRLVCLLLSVLAEVVLCRTVSKLETGVRPFFGEIDPLFSFCILQKMHL